LDLFVMEVVGFADVAGAGHGPKARVRREKYRGWFANQRAWVPHFGRLKQIFPSAEHRGHCCDISAAMVGEQGARKRKVDVRK
jgi:hypothetical protein